MADLKTDQDIQPRAKEAVRWARPALAAAVFILSLGVYIFTLAPTVTFVDSGELITAAHALGVAHPPGTPLYILLAHIAQLVPVGSVAARVNFASALFAAMGAAVAALLVGELLRSAAPRPAKSIQPRDKRKGAKRPPAVRLKEADGRASQDSTLVILSGMLVSGLLLAFSRTLWAYATIAEVYTLNALLTLSIFFLIFRWRRLVKQTAAQDATTRPDRLLYSAAFTFGLAMGVHHVTIALLLPALAFLVYSTEGIEFFKSRRLIYATLFALAGLAIYVYLPVAASRSPIINWGDPKTFERFWWHVTGRQYQVFFSPSLDTMAGQLKEFIGFAANQFGPWWSLAGLAAVVAGFVHIFRRDKTVFIFFALIIILDLAIALNYDIAEDKDAYYLPIFISMAVAAGFGVAWLIGSLLGTARPVIVARVASAVAVVLIPAVALAGNLPFNDRSRYYLARDYVENIFSTLEPNSLLLTLDWQVYSPMLYVSEVERERRDVVAIDVNQLRRSWYFDYLNKTYPSVTDANRDKVDAFLEDLRSWEKNPKAYEQSASLSARIDSRFRDLILSIVSNHIKAAPVYVTQEILSIFSYLSDIKRRNKDMKPADYHQDGSWIMPLCEMYQPVPQGLVFQLRPDRAFHEPARPAFSMRGINDSTLKITEEDVVSRKVLPVYLGMTVNRGLYLAAHGRRQQAIEAIEEALNIDPRFPPALQALERLRQSGPP